MAVTSLYQMYSNGLLLGVGYNDLRLRMEGCGGVEKFWSFGPKLLNRPPYSSVRCALWHVATALNSHGILFDFGCPGLLPGREQWEKIFIHPRNFVSFYAPFVFLVDWADVFITERRTSPSAPHITERISHEK